MHLTLKQQTASPPQTTMVDQQRVMDRFRHDYNDVRPHEALGQTPPARHYAPSHRPMPETPPGAQYRSGFQVRQVGPNGYVSWLGEPMQLGKLLASQPVGFREIDNDEWELHYGPVMLGHVLLRDGKPRLERLR